jgi:hypothetical protein
MKISRLLIPLLAAVAFGGCASSGGSSFGGVARTAMTQAIAQEPKGTYFVGRRYFKKDYKFWGYIRPSGSPWTTAKLVMMNEQTKLAPDRERGEIGSDNNDEYKLFGDFTGQTVYEPASNGFYPEFRLRGYELLSTDPAPIYREQGATNPERRIIAKPY